VRKMKPLTIITTALVIVLFLIAYASANSAEQIKMDIESMGITVRDVVINEDGVTVSYVYPSRQNVGDTAYDWIKIGTAVILNTESKTQIIRIRPEIKEVPVYEAQMDSRDLVLFLDGRISPEILLLNIEYVYLPEQEGEVAAPSLTFESRSKSSGSIVQIPLTLRGLKEKIGNMDITLSYDPSVLDAKEVIKGSLTTKALFDYNILEGTIKISLADEEGFSGDGSIAHVKFNVIGAEGSSSPLTIVAIAANKAEDYETLEVPTNDGVFRVISMEESRGDGDGDGGFTALDALYALQMAVGKIPEDLAMDMNGDGSVTSLDAQKILKIAVGEE